MIQVGGHAATLLDFEIPARHGLRQTIGDTLGDRRHLPLAAHDPRDARHRRRHGRAVPRRLAAELHEPDGHAVLGDLRRHAGPQRVVGLCHSVQNTTRGWPSSSACRSRRSTFRGAGVNHQAWILRFERDGRRPLPAAGRGHRARPGAAPARARRDVPPLRLLPHRVERALGRVPALVHATRRDDRAVPHARRRVREPQRGEPRALRRDAARRLRPAGRSRSSAASSMRR